MECYYHHTYQQMRTIRVTLNEPIQWYYGIRLLGQFRNKSGGAGIVYFINEIILRFTWSHRCCVLSIRTMTAF
jgi:hypothetical protein